MKIPKKLAIIAIALSLVTGCDKNFLSTQERAEKEAREKARQQKGVEQQNYRWRQTIAEDETTILWCTFSFDNPGSPLITIPIKGKLTSGGKRPFAKYNYDGLDGEQPGYDGMYGESAPYRYGFGTGGQGEYYELSDLDYLCTTVPTVFQKEKTEIVFRSDRQLQEATIAAQKAIAFMRNDKSQSNITECNPAESKEMNHKLIILVLASLLHGCNVVFVVVDAYRTSYEQYEALRAIAQNVCQYELAYEESSEKNKSDRLSFLLAQKNNYTQVAAKYNAAVKNALDRKYIKPLDLPKVAPQLDEMQELVCD